MMKHPRAYEKQKVIVLGLARSGRAVAEVMHRAGAHVIVNDMKARELCSEADELEAMGVKVICGHHPDDLVDEQVALLIKNPGIPYHAAPVQQALAHGIKVVTEIEVAYQLRPERMIGVTGSNGKTTTTSWIGHMMERAELVPLVAGNIGTPLCDAVREADDEQWIVTELSSFQLKGTETFKPDVAVLLNIAETHLDYHGTMADYISSKQRLLRQQTADDVAIINWDDPICRQLVEGMQAQLIPFSTKDKLSTGVYIDDGWIVSASDGQVQRIAPTTAVALRGSFNLENALAVAAVALQLGISDAAIAASLHSFPGVEHRLEFVREIAGIQFYNNSKSTNPSSTLKALQAFAEQPIVLIAGGQVRGTSFNSLLPAFKQRIKGLVTLGAAKDELFALGEQAGIKHLQRIEETSDRQKAIEQAVQIAYEYAAPGDMVLLSPACASWDMFSSFEERGRMFKQAVHTLK